MMKRRTKKVKASTNIASDNTIKAGKNVINKDPEDDNKIGIENTTKRMRRKRKSATTNTLTKEKIPRIAKQKTKEEESQKDKEKNDPQNSDDQAKKTEMKTDRNICRINKRKNAPKQRIPKEEQVGKTKYMTLRSTIGLNLTRKTNNEQSMDRQKEDKVDHTKDSETDSNSEIYITHKVLNDKKLREENGKIDKKEKIQSHKKKDQATDEKTRPAHVKETKFECEVDQKDNGQSYKKNSEGNKRRRAHVEATKFECNDEQKDKRQHDKLKKVSKVYKTRQAHVEKTKSVVGQEDKRQSDKNKHGPKDEKTGPAYSEETDHDSGIGDKNKKNDRKGYKTRLDDAFDQKNKKQHYKVKHKPEDDETERAHLEKLNMKVRLIRKIRNKVEKRKRNQKGTILLDRQTKHEGECQDKEKIKSVKKKQGPKDDKAERENCEESEYESEVDEQKHEKITKLAPLHEAENDCELYKKDMRQQNKMKNKPKDDKNKREHNKKKNEAKYDKTKRAHFEESEYESDIDEKDKKHKPKCDSTGHLHLEESEYDSENDEKDKTQREKMKHQPKDDKSRRKHLDASEYDSQVDKIYQTHSHKMKHGKKDDKTKRKHERNKFEAKDDKTKKEHLEESEYESGVEEKNRTQSDKTKCEPKYDSTRRANLEESESESEVDEKDKRQCDQMKHQPKDEKNQRAQLEESEYESDVDEKDKKNEPRCDSTGEVHLEESEYDSENDEKDKTQREKLKHQPKDDESIREHLDESEYDSQVDEKDQTQSNKLKHGQKDVKTKRKHDKKKLEAKDNKTKRGHLEESEYENGVKEKNRTQSDKMKCEPKYDSTRRENFKKSESETDVDEKDKRQCDQMKHQPKDEKNQRAQLEESEYESDVDEKDKKNEPRCDSTGEVHLEESEYDSENDEKDKTQREKLKNQPKDDKSRREHLHESEYESDVDEKDKKHKPRCDSTGQVHLEESESDCEDYRKDKTQRDKMKHQPKEDKFRREHLEESEYESGVKEKNRTQSDKMKCEPKYDSTRRENFKKSESESEVDEKDKTQRDQLKHRPKDDKTKRGHLEESEYESDIDDKDKKHEPRCDSTGQVHLEESEYDSENDEKDKTQRDKMKNQPKDDKSRREHLHESEYESDVDEKVKKHKPRCDSTGQVHLEESEYDSENDWKDKTQRVKMKHQPKDDKSRREHLDESEYDSDVYEKVKKHKPRCDSTGQVHLEESEYDSEDDWKDKTQRVKMKHQPKDDKSRREHLDESEYDSQVDEIYQTQSNKMKHSQKDDKTKREHDKKKHEVKDDKTKIEHLEESEYESGVEQKYRTQSDQIKRDQNNDSTRRANLVESESEVDEKDKRQRDKIKHQPKDDKTKRAHLEKSDYDSEVDEEDKRQRNKIYLETKYDNSRREHLERSEYEIESDKKDKRQHDQKKHEPKDEKTERSHESETEVNKKNKRRSDSIKMQKPNYETKSSETESDNDFQTESGRYRKQKDRTNYKTHYDMVYESKTTKNRKRKYSEENDEIDEIKNDIKNESESDRDDIIKKLNEMHQFYITLTKAEWLEYRPKDDHENAVKPKMSRGWTDLIYDKINMIIPTCPLKTSYHNISKMKQRSARYLTGEIICKHEKCAKFNIEIKDEPSDEDLVIRIKVRLTRPIRNHAAGKVEPKKRKLTGKRRQKMKESLKKSTASNLHYSIFGEMKEEEIQFGNYTKCQTEEILRKLKSEVNKDDILHPDPFTELVIVKDVIDYVAKYDGDDWGYIKELSYDPFMVTMYTPLSVEVAKKAVSKGDGVFHFDATGSVVKMLSKRKVFYYALVVKKVDNKTASVPVLEFLSNNHGTYHLCRPLQVFFCHLGKSLPKTIIVDFSWALIHSVLLSVNIMDIHTYLRACYEVVRGKREKTFTVVYLCSTHMLKAVRDNMRDRVRDKALRHIALRVFAMMQNVTSIHQSRALWKIWCVVFGSREMTAEVQSRTEELLNILKMADVNALDTDLVCDIDKESDDELLPVVARKGPIREQSPFRPLYQNYIPEQDTNVTISNKYYNLEVLEMMVSNYLPLIPLWSGMMLQDETRENNAPVESWMGVLKNSVIQEERSLRLAKFVWMIGPVLKGRLRKHQQHQKTEPPRKKAKFDSDEADRAEEGWRPKRGRTVKTKEQTGVYYETKDLPKPKGTTNRVNVKEKKKTQSKNPRFQKKRVVPGIVNVRNTCWLNSALQCLASLPGFMLEDHHPLPSTVQDVLVMIRTATFSGLDRINPEDLRDIIETELPDMPLGEEHDSVHFISEVMQKNTPSKTGFEFKIQSTRICYRCNRPRISSEDANILTLEIPRREIRDYPSIVDCLREFEKEEGLTLENDNAPRCDSCEMNTNTGLSLKVIHVRKGLFIQLKRYFANTTDSGRVKIRKDSNPVRLNRFVTISGVGFYRLYAVLI
ncbi:titin homolog [Ruditapes philippinarum]|uniref:titin homolog n=1 Tax=Ruditapes philippinarum TaxID=129788 RepID=UPI00295A71E4|nr:titin homolog [Ruditapes philippinarum]